MKMITKKDLIDYLRKSPENLNFNIFGKMLDDYKATYESDEEVINKIKNIIINIIQDEESITPDDDTITELVDLITEELTDKITDFKTTIEDLIGHSVSGNFVVPAPTDNQAIVVGPYAFSNCTELASIDFEEIPTNQNNIIDCYAFSGCTNLTSLNLIGFNEIRWCFLSGSGVTTLYLSTDLNKFTSGSAAGEYVFSGASNLTDIYYTGTEAQWLAIDGLSNINLSESVTIHYEYDPSQNS